MTSARTRERLMQRLREQGIAQRAVLDQIRNVPRHLFVDEALATRAYEDTALPIGHGQTISQPFVVARMTEALLEGGAAGKVLEIGTGCGYQTAVLAPLVRRIYSIERIDALHRRARAAAQGTEHPQRAFPSRRRLPGLAGARAVRRHPDGGGAARRSGGLLEQLRIGGRLIVPVGPEGEQQLLRITRREGDRARNARSGDFRAAAGGTT